MKFTVILITCFATSFALKCYQALLEKDKVPVDDDNKDCPTGNDACYKTQFTRGGKDYIKYGCGKKEAGDKQEFCPKVNEEKTTRRKRNVEDNNCDVNIENSKEMTAKSAGDVACNDPYKLEDTSNSDMRKRYCYNGVAWDNEQYQGKGKYKDSPKCEIDTTQAAKIPESDNVRISTSKDSFDAAKAYEYGSENYYTVTPLYVHCNPTAYKKLKAAGVQKLTRTAAKATYQMDTSDVTEQNLDDVCESYTPAAAPNPLPTTADIMVNNAAVTTGGASIEANVILKCKGGKVAKVEDGKTVFNTYGTMFKLQPDGSLKNGDVVLDLNNLMTCEDADTTQGSGNAKSVTINTGVKVSIKDSTHTFTGAGAAQTIAKDVGDMTPSCAKDTDTLSSGGPITYANAADLANVKCEDKKDKYMKLDAQKCSGNVVCKVGGKEYKNSDNILEITTESIQVDISCKPNYALKTGAPESITYTYNSGSWSTTGDWSKVTCEKPKCSKANFPDFTAYKTGTTATGGIFPSEALGTDEIDQGDDVYLMCEKANYTTQYIDDIKLHAYKCDTTASGTVKVSGTAYVQCVEYTNCTTVAHCEEDGCNSAPQALLNNLVPLILMAMGYVLLF